MSVYELIIKPYLEYSTLQISLEIFAALFGILSVFFSIKKNILVYPTGIISTLIYVYILYNFGLLGDCLINVYYTIMSIYGWILWSQNTEDSVHVEVSKAKGKDWVVSIFLFVLSIFLVTLIYYFKPIIDSNFNSEGVVLGLYHLDWANWMDVFTTSLFLVGMWLMAKRKVENWLFWIVGDIICVPMMLYKGLGITSLQYLLFTFLAYQGWLAWKKTK
jgi:nicotinamide mononucleotide transporter